MRTTRAFLLSTVAMFIAAAASVPVMWRSRGVRPVRPPAVETQGPFDPSQSAALFVGVRKFAHDGTLEVPYAVDDAVDLAYMFALDRRVRLVPPERVVLALAGVPYKPESRVRLKKLQEAGAKIEAAAPADIIVQLQKQTAAAGRDGILIVSLATHGFVREGVPYVLGSTSLGRDPGTSLSAARISDITATTNARRSLLFVDACRERIDGGTRGMADPMTAAPQIRRMKGISGQVVFYAAPAGGWAYDHPSGNGVFTKAVVEGLSCQASARRGVVTVDTLRRFVEHQVRDWIRRYRDPKLDAAIQVSLDGDTHDMPLSCCWSCPERAGSPRRLATDDASVRALDEHDAPVWQWNAGEPIVRAELADLDGDAMQEAVVGVGDRLVVLGSEGKPRWSASGESAFRAFAVADLFRKHTFQVVSLFDDRATIHSGDGQLLSTYEHAGLRHVTVGRVTNRHAPKIVLVSDDRVILLDPKRFAAGSEVWSATLAPAQQIETVEVIDLDGDGRREIRLATAHGRELLIDFEGRKALRSYDQRGTRSE